MTVLQLIDNLTQLGVDLQVTDNKLKVQAPKGVLTPKLRTELVDRKPEILALLLERQASTVPTTISTGWGLSVQTVGRLIGGYGSGRANESAGLQAPVIDPNEMARQLQVTFKPLPKGFKNEAVLTFRKQLRLKLQDLGVDIVPWETATREYQYEIEVPVVKRKVTVTTRVVKSHINAFIDVEKPPSLLDTAKSTLADRFYAVYSQFALKGRKLSVMKITQMIGWAEANIQAIEDPSNTQAIVLTDFDYTFTSPYLPYSKKIPIGVGTLVRTFSEIAIGVSTEIFSILNMNLSDSTYPAEDIDGFVAKSLIPKIFVPVLPLPLSRFEIGTYDPQQSVYAEMLVRLGRELVPTGLLPDGFKLDDVVKKKSHRDIVDWIANGRTGVSYGFIAYAEPPQYDGPIEISAAEWEQLSPYADLSADEIRQTETGRRYLKTRIKGKTVYRQIPDIWLVSSRSGSKKTALKLERDIVRIGLQDRLILQLPQGIDSDKEDIKPSYDLYVMVAIALGAALYTPEAIEHGAAMVHFHGYPAAEWFQANEYCAGVQNPSVPCGTFESGAFNFLGMYDVAQRTDGPATLIGLVEPDHGTNIMASDMSYLLDRLKSGCQSKQIELGGRFFQSLKRECRTTQAHASSGGVLQGSGR
ncbi:MAG: hypothetical protein AAFY57_02710 [Cyanobacteria bacterium J06642_2]